MSKQEPIAYIKPLYSNPEEVDTIQVNSHLFYSESPILSEEDIETEGIYAVDEIKNEDILVLVSTDEDGEPEVVHISKADLLEEEYWFSLTLTKAFYEREGLL